MATGDLIWSDGSEIVLESSGSSVSDGSIVELTDDDLQSADIGGKPGAWIEFDTAATGFSAAPTTGAVINIYEQKINSDVADAPDVASTYLRDYVGTFYIKPADEQQKLRTWIPINKTGGKYWLEWLDGGAGTASIDAGWACRIIPTSEGQAA